MGKKYKLIKEFPGSCELGKIIDLDDVFMGMTYNYTSYPEFWQEIKEKTFKILEFGFKNGYSRKLDDKGCYKRIDKQEKVGLNLESMLNGLSSSGYYISVIKRLLDNAIFSIGDNIKTKDTKDEFQIDSFELCIDTIIAKGKSGIGSPLHLIEHYKEPSYRILKSCPIEGTIYSVERISDGAIFKLDDVIRNSEPNSHLYKYQVIEKFIINKENNICAITNLTNDNGLSIHKLEHREKSLFITEDGKDIFEGDSYYTVFFKETKDRSEPERWKVLGKFSAEKLVGLNKWSDDCKYFSSIEVANNYIELYKPIYSNNDMLKFGKTCFTNGTLKNYGISIVQLLEQYPHLQNQNK